MKAGYLNLKDAIILFIILFQTSLWNEPAYSQNEKPLRIISLAPHITEIIYCIDAESLLVGRTDFCLYPAAAREVESVGGYLNIDFEKITTLHPDIVLQFPNDENRRKLESLGFTVVDVPNETIAEILNGIRLTGKIVGKVPRAASIVAQIQDTLRQVADRMTNQAEPVSAILVVGRDRGAISNITLAGVNTYLNELWRMCGGDNAFPGVAIKYFSVNEEDLLKKDVEVILEFHPGWQLDPADERIEKNVWDFLRPMQAVVSNQIYIFNDRFFVVPGPRITKIALAFEKVIHNFRSVDQ